MKYDRLLVVLTLWMHDTAGTMSELVPALDDGANALKSHYLNSISINAGCELFIAFVRLFPHETKVRLNILRP